MIEPPEILAIRKQSEAIGDAYALTMAVIGATTPTEVLDRLTSFIAGRSNAAECACLIIDTDAEKLALVCASDAYEREHRGKKISGEVISDDVHFMLDKALDWARHGLVSRAEDSGFTRSDRPLPVLRGALIKPQAKPTFVGQSAGLIVPIIHRRRVVGVLWLGEIPDTEPSDWTITLLHCAAVYLGQAIGALLREREQLEAERQKHLEYQSQVSRLEKTNEKLRGAFRDRNKTLSMSAHEFRMPIGIIQGHLSTLRNLTSLTDTQRTTVTAIDKQCNRLLATIDEVLVTKRQEKPSLQLEPCDLTPLLHSWANDYRNLASNAFVQLETEVDGDLGIRRIDPRKLNSVITALLEGVFKHTIGSEPLWLKIGMDNETQLGIRVTDRVDLAFMPSEIDEIPYTTAGLMSVKELVDLHGGHMAIRQHKSGGIEYTIMIPAPLDETAAGDTNPLPAKAGRILIIDPDKEALYHIASTLAMHFEVLTARTEREAFWLLQQFPIDCAIVDLNYPLMTGFATAAELRKDPRRTRLPVLFTADVEPSGMALRRQGDLIEDVIVKPIDSEQLVEGIKQVLNDVRDRRMSDTSSRLDTLTGLMSRSNAARELEAQLQRSLTRRSFLTILLIDIDEMVEINKRHGRGIGNELIHEMGKTLVSVTRSQEFTARWGGDEFLCILPATSQPSGKSAGDRLRERLARCMADNISTTVSVGGATLDPRHPLKASDLLNRAETALRAAKELGGDKVIVWKEPSSSGSDLTKN